MKYLANLVNICIDRYENEDIYGRFYTSYDIEPTGFTGAVALLRKLEQFYDRLGFPLSTTEHRRFSGGSARKEEMTMVSNNRIGKQQGDKASFLVNVQYRQNATWQGTLRWIEGKKEINFRSALELIRLIDTANIADETE